MKKLTSLFCLLTIVIGSAMPAFADFKLRQQVTIGVGEDGFTQERAIWVKGTRERTESKFLDERMAGMMPQIAEVRQCDLRQTLKINDRSRKYLIEPFYDPTDKPLPSTTPTTTTKTTTEKTKGGLVTWTYTITDTGERRQMFGLTARHLIIRQTSESTKDSCQGESKMGVEENGWYVYLIPETANCQIERPRGEVREPRREIQSCRDRVVMKGTVRNPGMMLEGTTSILDAEGKPSMKTSIKTLDLSNATLEMSLFEIPSGYAEVSSEQALTAGGGMGAMMGGMMNGGKISADVPKTESNRKTVGIGFFTGNVAKLGQPALRQFVAERLGDADFNGVVLASASDATSGTFANVIGVEVKSVKESGAAKIGGLFGKVTGSDDAAKPGKSEAEIVITLYAADGKTVVATASAKGKADGKADDAVRAALTTALPQIYAKLK